MQLTTYKMRCIGHVCEIGIAISSQNATIIQKVPNMLPVQTYIMAEKQ